MDEAITPPSKKALKEALLLSEEVLKNIELAELPLATIALKTSRLARLLNDFDAEQAMEYEASGYPTTPGGVTPVVWELAVFAGRMYKEKEKEYAYLESVSELEETVATSKASLGVAQDADVSIASSNPYQIVQPKVGNSIERGMLRQEITKATRRIASRRAFIHSWARKKNIELKFSGIADDIFTRLRERVDDAIGSHLPDSIKRLSAAYDNLESDNPEDWSNAVHSCRKILQDLADALYPAADAPIVKPIGGKKTEIKVGKENFINRLVAFAESNSGSKRFEELVGSQLEYLGNRLDAVFKAAQKGSHKDIVTREEADRYVIYTYLLVGDLLSLRGGEQSPSKQSGGAAAP